MAATAAASSRHETVAPSTVAPSTVAVHVVCDGVVSHTISAVVPGGSGPAGLVREAMKSPFVRAGARVHDLGLVGLDVAAQRRGLLGELLDRREHELCLIEAGRHGDHLRALFAVRRGQVDADTARDRRLAVLARKLDIDRADDANVHGEVVVVVDPSEHRREQVGDLPRVRDQRAPGETALGVAQIAEHREHLVDALGIEPRAGLVTRLGRLPPWRTIRQRNAALVR